MNKTVTITSKNHRYANTYGGEIYQSDFYTDYYYSKNIADRIFRDLMFDTQCKKNYKNVREEE